MTTVTAPAPSPATTHDDHLTGLSPLAREREMTGLGGAASLFLAGVIQLGFGAAWAFLFYPPRSLAVAGAILAAAFALAAFVAAAREATLAVRWRKG